MLDDNRLSQYIKFMDSKKSFAATKTLEERAHFERQVEQRVLSFLDATDRRDLSLWIAGERELASEQRAEEQARAIGFEGDMYALPKPYHFYLLLKPIARNMAKVGREFTKHFDKIGE